MHRLLLVCLLAILGLCACAQEPVINDGELLHAIPGTQTIKVYNARGPLTAHRSQALLTRLGAQAPDASALERHLAIEQIVANSPLYAGNQVRILRDGEQAFPAIFAAIRSAQHYLYLEYYILEDVSCGGQSLSDLLIERRHAGVEIYVIYDAIGSMMTGSEFFRRLHQEGVHLVEFHPLNPWKARHGWWLNARDHRKILVADGERAIVGGVNLSSTYESAPASSGRGREAGEVWHDIDAEITGPAVIELEKLFVAHWDDQSEAVLDLPGDAAALQESGDEIVRVLGSNPRRRRSPYYATALSAIRNAETSVWIMAAYFVPTHREMHDLIAAARRGVDVTLLLPARSDSGPALAVQRSHYGALLQAGVKIYERDDGILHSKSMVVDRVWCMVGSSNFDRRSVLFNDEVDVVLLGRSTGDQVSEAFEDGLHHAHAVDLQEWKHRPILTRLNEQFWRLWEGLL